jgi:nucleotide-binding universal stress UspA family protein
MSIQTTRPVVVGTDGSPEANAAVELGAWESDRRGVPLRLVHGYAVSMPYASMAIGLYPSDIGYPIEQGRAMLTEAVERVHAVYPRLTVDTAIATGSPAGALVEESRRAALVIVGSRGHGGFAGLLLGSVSAQLAAHSHSPLIVVRPSAEGEHNVTGAPPHLPVVVGVDGLPDSEGALAFGFDEAALRGVPLVALYAWWMLPWTNLGPVDLRHYDLVEAGEEARRMLAEAVAGWSDKYPDVRVELRPSHDMNPTLALLDASERAGLLVVSRHGGNALTRLVLGSVGDALVRQAPCPVAVVPEARH